MQDTTTNETNETLDTLYEAPVTRTVPEDLTHMEHAKKQSSWWGKLIAAGFLICIVAAAIMGFFFFGEGGDFKKERIHVRVDAPKESPSGGVVTYVVHYENKDAAPITNTRIALEFPEGFSFIESTPAASNDLRTVWDIGDVVSGTESTITVKGQIHGGNAEEKIMRAMLTYTPVKYRGEFSDEASAVTKIVQSVLSMETKGPLQITSQGVARFEVIYGDFVDVLGKDTVRLSVRFPDDFSVKDISPKPDIGSDSWSADLLQKGMDPVTKQGKIMITGSFGEKANGERALIAQMGFLDKERFVSEVTHEAKVQVIQSNLLTTLFINSSPEGRPVRLGEAMQYRVTYENTGSTPVRNARITARIDSPLVDWLSLKDTKGGKYSDGVITWTGKELPALATIPAFTKGEIAFTVRLKDSSVLPELRTAGVIKSDTSLLVSSFIEAQYTSSEEGTSDEGIVETKSGTIVNQIATDFGFQSQARYFDENNTALGSGPIPPRVDQMTTYRMVWNATNSLHEVQNLLVSATIPAGVEWSGVTHVDSGDISFDPQSRTVTWSLNRIPLSVPRVRATFDLTVTPRAEQANQVITLLGETNASATDSVNGARLVQKGKALTTNLDYDAIGRGKGLVTP